MRRSILIEPWGKGDLPLLERLMGDPRMTEHLGGPETPEKIRERQGRYERAEAGDRMFKIVDLASGAAVGSVGYWDKEWRETNVYEVGWMVLPEFQGRGLAVAATAQAIELARQDGRHRWMHAFPNLENAASNAICRKLGFTLLGAREFEYPKGHLMLCNDWQLDLGIHGVVRATNVELARRAFEGVLRGDLDLVGELLDRDVKWHGGDPDAPGACRNRRQALAFIDRARERLRGVEVLDLVGAGDTVVVIMGARAPDGEPAWTAASLSTFRDGKVVEIVHYPDPQDALAAANADA